MNPTHEEKKAIFAPNPASMESDAIKLPAAGGPADHRCEHAGCAKWASWGFTYGREQRWFCGDHKGNGY